MSDSYAKSEVPRGLWLSEITLSAGVEFTILWPIISTVCHSNHLADSGVIG